jgi:hypothetical protein
MGKHFEGICEAIRRIFVKRDGGDLRSFILLILPTGCDKGNSD